jgi:hypothetical protein
MANTIRIKRSTGSTAPTTLENAELAYSEGADALYIGVGTGGEGGSATTIRTIASSTIFASQSENTVYAAPVGSSGAPSFRLLVIGDVTSLQDELDDKAPLASPALTGTPTAPTADTSENSTQIATTAFVKSLGYTTTSGTVTSVGLSLPAIFNVFGSPVTGAGTLGATLATQTASHVWAGPTSGLDAAPSFRALVAGDLPSHTHAVSDLVDVTSTASELNLLDGSSPGATVASKAVIYGTDGGVYGDKINGGGGLSLVGNNLVDSTGKFVLAQTRTLNDVTNALAVSWDTTGVSITNGLSVGGNLTVTGNLTINGTTTTVNSTTLSVDDKNIELGSVAIPDDTTADGGGITLRGATNKTLNWVNATGSWTSSEHIDLASEKVFKIATTTVLSATALGSGVTGSSLTSVGTIASGTWNGTAIAVANGGTGATDASTARSNLGLEIGTNVQAYDAELAAIAGLTSAADRLPYFTGSEAASLATFTSFARDLIDDADASTARGTLGLGTMATQASNNVDIDGGTIDGITIDGGTWS